MRIILLLLCGQLELIINFFGMLQQVHVVPGLVRCSISLVD